MKKRRCFNRLVVVASLLVLSVVLAACVGQPDVAARAWIDYPLGDRELVAGTPVPIVSHLYAKDGVKAFHIQINGETLHHGTPPDPEEAFRQITHEWIPEQAGEYTIEVIVQDPNGAALSKAQVDVTVLGERALPEPDLTVTGLSLVEGNKIRCEYSNLGGDALPEGRDVWMDIFIGPSEADLTQTTHANIGVDRLFEAGTEGAFTSAPLSPVPAWPQLVVCIIDAGDLVPESDEDNNEIQASLGLAITTTETLTPTPSGTPTLSPTLSATATLTATSTSTFRPTFTPTHTPRPPTDTPTSRPDTTPPSIANLQASADPITEPPCQPDSVTISVQVSDSSGLGDVKLYYRIVKGDQSGSWQTPLMNYVGGDQYELTLGPNQLKASMDPYGGKILQYYVKAWDTQGNVAETKSGNVQIQVCVQ